MHVNWIAEHYDAGSVITRDGCTWAHVFNSSPDNRDAKERAEEMVRGLNGLPLSLGDFT